ncbi:signal transduction histidine kinase [Antricoccus suffuscus]|uniref:histidine kinase n=1 Tax=Antricoccus suffuscus TaxID=1629062 RepID=A0A2T1A3K9_9ACTN|nr:ATP-binding protein [Antricoccus suffuscus]PRZ43124.1 signal transduction histidine kinase [Antricoccus suffuscus]
MRIRATLAATSVVLLALVAGGALLLVLLQQALVNDATSQTVSTARDLAGKYAGETVPGVPTLAKDLTHKGQEVQIVTSKDKVVAAAHEEYLEHSLVKTPAAPGQTVSYPAGSPHINAHEDDPVVTSVGFLSGGKAYAVNVMAEIDVQKQSVRTVGLYLLVGIPVLLLVVGWLTWLLVGRALHEVERIREQVDGVRRSRLSQRIDVPPTADEIARLATTMNAMLTRLEESDAAQRRFASDASHELRSPLATLNATLEIAIADETGDTWRDMQPVLLGQTGRMKSLVDDLLTLAKADDHQVHLRRTEQDLDDLIENEARAVGGGSSKQFVVRAEPIRVVCDGARIAQVLRNLLDNAERHANSRIWVSCRVEGGIATVDVDNDGPAVPRADRTRIFERFVRLDDSRSRDSGSSGLGLAIAAEFVTAHGGTIVATESPQGYCRFRFTLPVDDAP